MINYTVKSLFFGLIVGITTIIIGCTVTTVKSQILVPAKYSDAAKLKRIAVFPFIYNDGIDDNITAEIEAAIVSIRIDDKPYFSVIERIQMQKIINEQKLSSTGLLDQRTAVKAGRIAGVEAVLLGNVTQYDLSRAQFYKNRRRCTSRDSEGKCRYWSDIQVSCIRRTATFAFVPKLINVSTGNLVFSESISRQSHFNDCQSMTSHSDNQLLSSAKFKAINDFTNMIAPHYVTQNIALLSQDDSNPPGYVNKQIDSGIKFAKAGRLDRACTLWESAATEHEEGYVIPYLLGVCAESRGDLENADKYYKLADQRAITPINEINNALLRISTKTSEQSKLGKQLVKNDVAIITSSNIIIQAQKLLKELGYDPGPADGMMGRKTSQAILKYQKNTGLPQTGNIDIQTKNAMGIK